MQHYTKTLRHMASVSLCALALNATAAQAQDWGDWNDPNISADSIVGTEYEAVTAIESGALRQHIDGFTEEERARFNANFATQRAEAQQNFAEYNQQISALVSDAQTSGIFDSAKFQEAFEQLSPLGALGVSAETQATAGADVFVVSANNDIDTINGKGVFNGNGYSIFVERTRDDIPVILINNGTDTDTILPVGGGQILVGDQYTITTGSPDNTGGGTIIVR